jgi:hypothetical protein
MKKAILMKSIFLLCLLLAGAVSAHADGYDYVCEKVTDISELEGGETVLLVDQSKNLALSPSGETYGLKGVEIAIGEDNVIRNLSANIIWTIDVGSNSFKLYNDGYLWGSFSNYSVGVSNPPSDATYDLYLGNIGENGGKLYYEGYQGPAYFNWSTNDDKLISIGDNTGALFTLYKVTIKNYVKWKRVDGNKVKLNNNEEVDVVIVDLKTGKAMSNDKGDKDPAAVAVTLNDDQDRIIMDEVPENVQWKCNKLTALNITTVTFKTEDGQNLYADKSDKVLKVGNAEGDNNIKGFLLSVANQSLSISIDQTEYRCFSDDSMFSNVWKLGDSSDDNAKNAQIAIFKKVEDRQKIAKIEMAEYYNLYKDAIDYADLNASITGADFSEITWDSSKPGIATAATVTDEETNRTYGKVTGYQRGSTVITASVIETDYHDKASAKSTVIVDEVQSTVPGSLQNPLTVAQAKELAEKGKVTVNGTEVNLAEGVRYYIKGKVSKVNSGMMAMFGDMDFGEMMGGSGSGSSSFNFEDSMDDMDFDMEDMEESGFDMSSMGFDMSSLGFDMSAMFGTSDKVTYYISDDGTKDGQMKVINGCGTLNSGGSTAMEFNPIPKLSAGDCVVVCGPLVYTEDSSMFSGMMGGGSGDTKSSGKVDEMNYLAVYDPTLLITEPEQKEVYVNKTLDGKIDAEKPLYTIDELFDRFNENKFPEGVEIQPATYKSSDEDIAKWDDQTNLITGVNEGKAKITVKVKVIVVKDDPSTEDKNEEKSYTMKRKFKLIVKTRDVEPAGKYAGDYVLTTSDEFLEEGTRLILVGTRVKEDKETAEKTYTDYVMVENNAMMGGGKNGSKYEFEEGDNTKELIPCEKAPKGTLEVVLEPAEGGSWYLNVGKDENGDNLYLYASDTSEDKEEEQGDEQGDNKFDINKIMEMISPSSGLKTGTMAAATADSCKATISITDNIATISFPKTQGKNNTIMLSSSFDMEEMMGMFGGMGGNNNEEQDPDDPNQEDPNEEESTFDMGSFDMFMAAFNTKKEGEADDKKAFMPRIYRFVPDESFGIKVDGSGWSSIVTYNDVTIPEELEAYVVKDVTGSGNEKTAILAPAEGLKGGHPYLLHTENPDSFTLTLSNAVDAPVKNLLQVSDSKTGDGVFVLAKPEGQEAAFYVWDGGLLGSGRVYLPAESGASQARILIDFYVEPAGIATGITDVKQSSDMRAYDLQGRRVSVTKGQVTKGLYIVNGKKVVIK